MDKGYWIRSVKGELYRFRGQHRALIRALEDMPIEALEEFYRVLQEAQQEIHSAKRTVQIWPGGPKLRI